MNDAIWALIGVVVGGILTGWFNSNLQNKQFAHNKEMFLLQNRSKESVKEILLDLLWHKKFTDRSFVALKKHIGGYSDNEIRQMLHEVGAVKLVRNKDNSEWWYLKERETERIENLKSK